MIGDDDSPADAHVLQWVVKKNLGTTTYGARTTVWGSVGRCSCGQRFQWNNGAPSKGGRAAIEKMHGEHRDRVNEAREGVQ